jgi:hypothetical protein
MTERTTAGPRSTEGAAAAGPDGGHHLRAVRR